MQPTPVWQAAFLEMAAEFVAAGDQRYQDALADMAAYLAERRQFAEGRDLSPGYVPETAYWAVVGDMLVGCIRLRHHLTPRLHEIGGHIGYEVRPTQRGKGYGTRMLALALEQAWARGLPQVLLTCDTDNIGSARVIEKNGARLVAQGPIPGYPKAISRYVIERPPGDATGSF